MKNVYMKVNQEQYPDVVAKLASLGVRWRDGALSKAPTSADEFYLEVDEDSKLVWSHVEAPLGWQNGPQELDVEEFLKDKQYIEISEEAWDPIISKLREEGYTGFGGSFKPHTSYHSNKVYLTIHPNKLLDWSVDLDFLKQEGYTETTLDKLLGKLWYIEVKANEIQDARAYLEGAEIKSLDEGFMAVREYYVGNSPDKTVRAEHTLREDLLIKRGFEKREWKGMLELEALNYIKDNELSVTIAFDYCGGELDLVEITTAGDTYYLYEDFEKTTKVLEAIQLLESL